MKKYFMTVAAGALFISGTVHAHPQESSVKRFAALEQRFSEAKTLEEQKKFGSQLRFLYTRGGKFAEAAVISEKLYKLTPDAANAVSLGASYLNCRRDREALATFQRHQDPSDTMLSLYTALAKARLGDKLEAEQILARYNPAKMPRQAEKLVYARAAAANSDTGKTCTAIAAIMAGAQTYHHAFWEKYFAVNVDFATVRNSEEFKSALKTPSTAKVIPQKKRACGTCPNREKCAEKKAAAQEKSSCATCPNREKCAEKKATAQEKSSCATCPNREKCAEKKATAQKKSSCATCPNREKCAAKKAESNRKCCGNCSPGHETGTNTK